MEASERQVIGELMKQLEAEERALSARRRKLHDRIAIFTDETGTWEEQEREISRQRRVLHEQIDQLLDRAVKTRRAERSVERDSADTTAQQR
jgi:chromosome segregation ATPase